MKTLKFSQGFHEKSRIFTGLSKKSCGFHKGFPKTLVFIGFCKNAMVLMRVFLGFLAKPVVFIGLVFAKP